LIWRGKRIGSRLKWGRSFTSALAILPGPIYWITQADAGGGWTVIGVNLRSSTTRDGLAAQDYAYALKVQGVGVKQISVINTILLASEGQQPILQAMATADIISATVTEKGYHLDQHGQLDLQDPVIAADLTGPPRAQPHRFHRP
jgi:mannitol-1-phosphate/altronate dehydrogenase